MTCNSLNNLREGQIGVSPIVPFGAKNKNSRHEPLFCGLFTVRRVTIVDVIAQLG